MWLYEHVYILKLSHNGLDQKMRLFFAICLCPNSPIRKLKTKKKNKNSSRARSSFTFISHLSVLFSLNIGITHFFPPTFQKNGSIFILQIFLYQTHYKYMLILILFS